MTRQNVIAIGLTLISLGLLWPGLTAPVLTITASIDILGQSREVFRQSQSIVESVKTLYQGGNVFVAGLILLFSITIPFIKVALLAVVVSARDLATRRRVLRWVKSISKWAMADVFVVGVFIAFLAAKGTDNLDAVAERGFYYFAAYCLVSNLAFTFLSVPETATDSVSRSA